MKARENELQFISVVLDLLVLNFTILIFAFTFYGFHINKPSDIYLCVLLANLSWVLAFIFIRKKILYMKKGYRPRLYRMLKRTIVFLFIQGILFLPLMSLIGDFWLFLLTSSLVFAFAKLFANFVYFKMVKYYNKKSSHVKRALLIGDNQTMRKVKRIIKVNPVLNYKFIGFLSDNLQGKNVLGSCDSFIEVIKNHNIHVVFVAVKTPDELISDCAKKNELLHTCNQLGVRLLYVPENEAIEMGSDKMEKMNGITLINPQKIPLDHIENQIKKRMFDLVFSGMVILFVLSWLYPLLGLLIKLSSKGPVLFIQKRTGVNKVTFNCYKFRSMRPNNDSDLKQATEADPRITRIGKFLRSTNIDELPQFINVFRGEMSVVGPRPHMLSHTDKYSALIDDYLVRHYVKPGITGWAQISGFRGETDELWKMEKRVEYDKEYINNWSFDWDFLIVWKTIFDLKAFMNAR